VPTSVAPHSVKPRERFHHASHTGVIMVLVGPVFRQLLRRRHKPPQRQRGGLCDRGDDQAASDTTVTRRNG
jgi:hypothetical protein